MPLPGKKWLELPILDAFNSPRKIDNLWSDDLEIDYNFSMVRRFDRCTTCHQLIGKTMPGRADVPAYDQEHFVHPAQSRESGGGAGIRTPGRLAPTAVFKTPVGQRLTTPCNSRQLDDGGLGAGATVVHAAESGDSLPLNGPRMDHER